MKRIACAALVGLVLAGPAAGADIGYGMLAYDQGDYDTALAEWTPLAEGGDAMAQSLLGMLYRTGEGVGRDIAVAAQWYERAAQQAHPYAQYNLGEMYRDGEGVSQDLVEAFVWFALAADQIPPSADGTSSASMARDSVAAQLTEAQLAQAQERAAAFMPAAQ